MAAPSGIVWGEIYGNNRGRIGIYTNVTNAATQTTVNVQVWIWTRYSAYDSTNNLYFDVGIGVTAASTNLGSISFNHSTNSSWSTANQTKILDKTYTYKRGKSAATYTVYSRLQGVDWVNAIMHAKTTFTVPALASYTVTYDANGGTGAPSAQTKWYDETLTLSSAKPTRTGYTFAGWLSSAQNQSYAAGAFYGHNESTKMVAQWTANTYTVSYDANGGTGAPAAQTKTYGVTLALSNVLPTKANHNFLGWATSPAATTAAYASGANYTANAAATLYAVWELAYTPPTISNATAERCSADGTADDGGAYAKVSFAWVLDQTQGTNNVSSIKIRYKATSATAWETVAVTATGTSGAVNEVIGGNLTEDDAYNVEISVLDSMAGTTTINRTVPAAIFPIDFLAGGRGVAMGKPASKVNAFDCGFTQYDKYGALVGNGLAAYTGGGDNGIDPDTTLEGLCLTSHTNAPQGLGTFYFIYTVFYNTKSATAARAQFAFPYNKNGSSYHRVYKSGEWTPWESQALASYPVGSYYISANSTSPASLFGGTWHRIESRFLWGAPASSMLGITGGESTHTLTTNEIPSHAHSMTHFISPVSGNGNAWVDIANGSSGNVAYWSTKNTQATGGGAAHNNMPPYVNVAIWRREA